MHLNDCIKTPRICRPLPQSRLPPLRSDFGCVKGGVGKICMTKVSGRRSAETRSYVIGVVCEPFGTGRGVGRQPVVAMSGMWLASGRLALTDARCCNSLFTYRQFYFKLNNLYLMMPYLIKQNIQFVNHEFIYVIKP